MIAASEEFSRIVRFAVNNQGNIRLLDSELNGKNNSEPKKNETLLEVPSVQWVQALENAVNGVDGKVGELETEIAILEGAATSLTGKADTLPSQY
ncbi:MAG: hypothetical protein V1932_02035 [Chloroflexota bacterium]